MDQNGYWQRFTQARLSRRRALRGGAALGAGAIALSLIGCGGDDEPGSTGGTTGTNGGSTGATGGSTGATGGSTGATGGTGSTGGTTSGLIAEPVDTTAQAKAGGILKDFQARDILHFDALESATAAVVGDVSVYAYPRLLRYTAAIYPDLPTYATEGEVAESFEESPDGLTITLKIRQGMKWDARPPTSGRTIDAQDVVFSFNKFRELHQNAGDLRAIETLTAPDDSTIVITLSEYDPSIIPLLADRARLYVGPRESDGGFDPKTEIRGHGPYILDEYVPSSRVVWKKNPDYWLKGMPFFDAIEKPIITEYSTQLAQFRTGNIYTPVASGPDLLQAVKDNAALKLSQEALYDQSLGRFLSFGYEGDSIFKDQRVRQAASMAIDRDATNDIVFDLANLEAEGIDMKVAYQAMVGPGFFNFWLDPQDEAKFGESARILQYNPEEAAKLLSAAGGRTEFDFVSNADNNYGALYSRERDAFDAMLRAVGFEPNQKPIPYAQFIPEWSYAYTGDNTGFSGLILRAISASATIDQFLHRQYHPDGSHHCGSTPDGNNARAGDPKVVSEVERIKQERDPEAKRQMVDDLNRYWTGQMYMIPRPAQVLELTLPWPVIGNYGAHLYPLNGSEQQERMLHWWLDESKAPLA